ncbi:MAG: hypothetical protein ABSF77_21030 [Spirochaetia bacterium]
MPSHSGNPRVDPVSLPTQPTYHAARTLDHTTYALDLTSQNLDLTSQNLDLTSRGCTSGK